MGARHALVAHACIVFLDVLMLDTFLVDNTRCSDENDFLLTWTYLDGRYGGIRKVRKTVLIWKGA